MKNPRRTLKEAGVEEVYHLEGGILKYLEEVPAEDSLWEGQCFVFDERVSVGQDLEIGEYDLCRGCRRPLSEADTQSEHYVRGVSCHRCIDETTPEQKLGLPSGSGRWISLKSDLSGPVAPYTPDRGLSAGGCHHVSHVLV